MKSSLVLVAILFLTMAYLPQSLCAAPGRTIEKSFPVPMGGKLVLDLDTGGNVEIAGWDKPEIAVTVAIGGDDADRVNVGFETGSSLLRIHSDCEKRRHADIGELITAVRRSGKPPNVFVSDEYCALDTRHIPAAWDIESNAWVARFRSPGAEYIVVITPGL